MSLTYSAPQLLYIVHRELGIPLWVLVRSVCNESVPLPDRVSEFLYPEDVARLEEFSRSKPSVSSVLSQLLTLSGIRPAPSSVPQALIPPLQRALSTFTPRGLTLAFGNWVSFPSQSLADDPGLSPVISYLLEPSSPKEQGIREDEVFFYTLVTLPRLLASQQRDPSPVF